MKMQDFLGFFLVLLLKKLKSKSQTLAHKVHHAGYFPLPSNFLDKQRQVQTPAAS